VICTDKTGTLTENRLRVAASLPEPEVSVRRLLEAALLASTAGARTGTADRLVLPDPLDAAVLEEARGQGVDVGVLLATNELLGEVPFDPKRRRVSALYGSVDGRRLVVKGAPEVVLERSWAGAGDHDRVKGLIESLADQGVRVLAVAERRLGAREDAAAELDHDLTLLGLVGFRDPLRPAVPEAVREARSAGIDVVMITGDHPVTARAIGRSLGLAPDAIRARVDPEAKLELVTALQARGEVVAVTGDGVNDAAALRRADVGVAMGKAGTEAAREASAIVLTDDDFSTIVAAVREGRRIGDNLRKFVAFLLSANLGEVVAFTIAVLAGLGPPLTVVQVLVVNVLTDSLPAIALSRDPAAPGVMARGPDRRGQLFARRTWVALGLVSLTVGGAALAAFVIGRDGDGVATGQTMAFATLALAELALVFSVRSAELAAWREPWNGSLVLAVLGSLAVLALIMLVPALHEPFGVLDLSAAQLAVVVGLAAAPALLVELAKALRRSRSRR
jgi:Ca2+-transporting ATPase